MWRGYMYSCVLVTVGARKGHWGSWNWRVTRMNSLPRVLGTELPFSERAASALNLCTVLPIPHRCCSEPVTLTKFPKAVLGCSL